MNALSLAYSNAKKQPLWIDDPFDLKGFVTGVTPLSHQRTLEEYAQELVSSYGEFIGDQYELNLEKLSSPYQLELVRLYIESIDREIEWACYGDDQSINSDFLCAMLAMLKDSNPKTRANFAQVTTRNLLAYYGEALQNVLDEACHDLHCNEMNNAGYHQEQDMEHGDFRWSR
jgi:hypothetical protein